MSKLQTQILREAFTLRLKLLVRNSDKKITQKSLGKICGVTQEAAGKWFNSKGIPKHESILTLSKYFNVDPAWLEYGKNILNTSTPTIDILNKHITGKIHLDNVEYINETDLKIKKTYENLPSLTYKQIRKINEEYNILHPQGSTKNSKYPPLFKIKVSGDSMLASSGAPDTFPKGTEITINTEKTNAKEGDFVLAISEDYSAINFRQYRISEEKPFLYALNTDYKPIFDNFNIIGIITRALYEKNYN